MASFLQAEAGLKEFNMSYAYSQSKAANAFFDTEDSTTLPSKNYLFSAIVGVSDHFQVRPQIALNKRDYSSYTLKDSSNEDKGVSFNKVESQFGIGLDYAQGQHLASVDFLSSVGDALNNSQILSGSYSFFLYNKSTEINFKSEFSKLKRPDDYFLNPSFKLLKRKNILNQQRHALSVNQIIGERMRSLTSLQFENTLEERPWAVGIEETLAVALSESFVASVKGSYFNDLGNPTALTDRGRFKSWAVGGELQYEAYYDFWIKGAYTLSSQQEEINSLNINRRIASDRWSLSASYALNDYNFELSSNYTQTNTDAEFLGLSLGLGKVF